MLASGLGGVDTLPFRAKIAQFAPCLLLHLPTSTPGQCLRANTFLCFSLQHWEGVSYWSNLCSFTEVQNCYFGFYWQLLPFRRESLSPLNWFYYFTFIRPRLPVSTFICTLLGVFTPLKCSRYLLRCPLWEAIALGIKIPPGPTMRTQARGGHQHGLKRQIWIQLTSGLQNLWILLGAFSKQSEQRGNFPSLECLPVVSKSKLQWDEQAWPDLTTDPKSAPIISTIVIQPRAIF